MLIRKKSQYGLSDFPFTEFIFNKEHPLILLRDAIDWDNLVEHLAQFYSLNKGRPTISLRAKAGTEIVKRLKNLSDREAVAYVEENIYAQSFCGLLPSQVSGYMNRKNGLANFRGQIGKEGLKFINEILLAAATKKPLRKGNKLILDTTCVPVDIHYPTDIRLLERCRQEIIRLMEKSKKLGIKIAYRTYNRTAKKVFTVFSKLSKPKEKTRKKTHKKMIQFARRNLKQLIDLRRKAGEKLGRLAKVDWKIAGFLKRLKTAEKLIRLILHQQKQVYQDKRQINGRVVSFHKDHIRPIKRGKFPLDTEFGPKVLIALVKGYTYVVETFQNNAADSNMVISSLRWFKQAFGRLPKEIIGDRGFFSQWNVTLLKSLSINCGLQQRGRVISVSCAQRRMSRQRLPIEARISLLKRKFGWNRCRARNPEHESCWIHLNASAMNASLAFGLSP